MPFADRRVEIQESAEFPDTGTFTGHDGVRKLIALFTDTFEDFRMKPEDFIGGPDESVVVVVSVTGAAKASGIPVEIRSFHVHTVRGGKSVRMRVYLNEEIALEAAGLSE